MMSRVLVVWIAVIGCGRPAADRDINDAPVDDSVPGDAPDPPDAPDAAIAVDARPDAPPIDARPIDAPSGVPDLRFIDDEMTGTWIVTNDNFRANDCEVMEGCVAGAGARQLLRFDTVTSNRGTGDLVVGVPPPRGVSNDTFQWSECHMHHHVMNYTTYELVNSTGVVMTGRKQAFCLEDGEQVEPGAPATGYSCTNQGISRGWADVYTRYLPCQWIDVTAIPHGSYTLRITLNPLHTLPESDYTHNVFTVPVNL